MDKRRSFSRYIGFAAAIIITLTAGALSAQTQEIKIASIQVQGNVTTDSSLIVATSRLRPGQRLTGTNIQDAVKKLYSLGIFSDIRVESAGESADGVALLIAVDEYPMIDDIRITGNEEIDLKKLQTEINLVKGQIVSPLDIKNATRTILNLYKEKGFYLADVDVKQRRIEEEQKVLLEFTITEGKKIRIRSIDFVGNDNIKAGKLRRIMETKARPSGWFFWRKGDFQKDTFEEDKKKLELYYMTQGFRDVKVMKHEVVYDSTRENMHITVTLKEGLQYRMGTLSFNGNTIYPEADLAAGYKLKPGEVFNQELYQLSTYGLYMMYQEKGYIKVAIDPVESTDSTVINLTYQIKEGKPSTINKIHIKGNTKTREKVIRRELVMKPGEVFRRSALDRSQREIYQLNYFGNITYDFRELEGDLIDVIFNVEEKSTGRASLGAAYGTDGLMGTVGLSTPNLWGNGQNMDFNWDFGEDKNTFEISFTEPWLLNTPTTAGLSLYDITRPYELYLYERKTGASLRLGRTKIEQLDYFKAYVKYGLNRIVGVETFTKDFNVVEYDMTTGDSSVTTVQNSFQKFPVTWESSIGLTIIRDSRDLPEFANRGLYTSYYLKLAGGILLGDENYYKHVLNINWYIPTFWKLVLIPKFNIGYAEGWGEGNAQNVPYYDQFRPGGRSLDGEVRGYTDYSMAPPIPNNTSYTGGRFMTVANLEYRFPLVEKTFYGLFFFDMGYAWTNMGDFNIDDVVDNKGAGFGIRASIPMLGTLGFDFGYGMNKTGDFWDKWEYHFQFGKMF